VAVVGVSDVAEDLATALLVIDAGVPRDRAPPVEAGLGGALIVGDAGAEPLRGALSGQAEPGALAIHAPPSGRDAVVVRLARGGEGRRLAVGVAKACRVGGDE